VQAYFSEEQCVEISGETRSFNGLEVDGVASAIGTPLDYHFCPTCGSTIYWTIVARPGGTMIGIAVGNFVDPDFAAPAREYYTKLRHRWLLPITSAEQFSAFPDPQDRYQAF